MKTAIVLLALFSSLLPAELATAQWTYEYADTLGTVGMSSSLALDAQDEPHIVSKSNVPTEIRYAQKSSGAWATESATAPGPISGSMSLKMGAGEVAHVAFVASEDSKYRIKYATRSAGLWIFESVDSVGTLSDPFSPCFVLSLAGAPTISYFTGPATADLRYATKSGGTWTVETVDAAGNVGRYSSLVFDLSGQPNISYESFGGPVKFAQKVGGAWMIETVVDDYGLEAKPTSISIDDQGNPHIAYVYCVGDEEYSTCTIRHAVKTAGTWTVDDVAYLGNSCGYAQVATPPSGGVFIGFNPNGCNSWSGFYQCDLMLATQSYGAWTLTPVDTLGALTAGSFCLGTGPQGFLEFSYYDNGNTNLKFAVRNPTSVPALSPKELGVVIQPNPSTGGPIEVAFHLPEERFVAASIADVAGRRVRVLGRGTYPAGPRTLSWDGRDEDGRRLPAGVYFLRLDTGQQSETAKLVLLK